MICGLVEACSILILFCFRIDHDNLHSPVSKRKAGDTTVSARSVENMISKEDFEKVKHCVERFGFRVTVEEGGEL